MKTAERMVHGWSIPRTVISRGRWFVPFALVSAIWVAGFVVSYHARLDVMHRMMPTTATSLDHAEAEAAMLASETVRAAFLPIRILIGGSVLAFVLFSFVRVLEPPKPLRMAQALAIMFMSGLSLAVGYLAICVVPPGAIRFPIAPAPLSLQTWFNSPSWVITTILANINPFQCAAIVAMGLWLAALTEMGKMKSLFIALAITALGIFTQICLMQFVGGNVGLLQ